MRALYDFIVQDDYFNISQHYMWIRFIFQSVVKLMQGLLQCMMRQVWHLTLWAYSFVILNPLIWA